MNEKICFYARPIPKIKSFYDMIDYSVKFGFTALEGFNHFELSSPDKEEAKKIKAYMDKNNIICI